MTHRLALMTTVTPRAFANDGYTPTADDVALARQNAERASLGAADDELLRRSKDSAFMLPYWDQVDAIMRGIRGMREARETFLPKFVDEDDKDYEERLRFTKMTNVFRDIVESLSAKPFEQEVALAKADDETIPEPFEKFIEDVDGSGNNLTQFAGTTFFNGIGYTIDWIMVDYPKQDGPIRRVVSRAEHAASGVRPYWSHVLGRNVLEVQSKVIKGKEVLTYIRILEPGDKTRVRVFERSEAGAVTWTLYEKATDTGNMNEIESGVVSIGEIPLVSFITGRRDGRSWRFDPALSDAADLQVDLYQQESGLKFASTLTAYPMLSGNGVKPAMMPDGKTPKKLAVGPKRTLYAPPGADGGSGGSWAYVEPGAQSLKFLAGQITATIQEMRELGKQPLTAQSGNLTVITTAVAASKAKSAVAQWALSLKDALENALVLTGKFLSITQEQYDPQAYVYSDFDDFTEGKDLETLANMRENGDLSQLTYWDEMKRRKVLKGDFDAKTETQRLLKEIPADYNNPGDDDVDPVNPAVQEDA